MYALNLGSVLETDNDRRILSVTFDKYAPADQPRVDALPEGSVSDYLYVDGEYVFSPLARSEDEA